MLEKPIIPKEIELPEVHVWDNDDETTIPELIKKFILSKDTEPETEAEKL